MCGRLQRYRGSPGDYSATLPLVILVLVLEPIRTRSLPVGLRPAAARSL